MYLAAEDRYDTMPYRRVGRSGLRLPAISLGLWHNFGDERGLETQRAILRRAFDLGVTHFDLANNYGPPPGAAEANFGELFERDLRPHRDEIIVSTKAGYLMWPGPYGEWGSRKYLLSSLDQSLSRLRLDYVDIFYSHRPDPETPLEETMGALHSAVQQGKALYVGISNYSAEQTAEAARILAGLGTPLLIHQPRYSMLDRWVEGGLLDTLEEVGAGSIAFSPLEQGLLTDRYLHGIPEGSRAAGSSPFLTAEKITEDKLAVIRALDDVARRRGQSLAQMAVAWILRGGRVTSALVGASSVRQLEDNVAAARTLDFSDDELAEIERILGGAGG
ncbi:L-glyceraldehyde 3-phosphate reductase [Motilibacter rhizosphaerae]|uniref:L-glyceraldehyde 3-phosphate reductase n=1 Tax=Motilibacter rhizosphaerae TaxID=598652 RepID=A0A4V2F4Y2_9ACTN|nr:L-glyceraldehyde 3-phosphate reductase [Motilibacter rhizosphaerae]RZS90909.1 L-glyceraldehyde 3-phosphate reductase [Motilibacter rhizosphaerae]